jgi:hypothetical protein
MGRMTGLMPVGSPDPFEKRFKLARGTKMKRVGLLSSGLLIMAIGGCADTSARMAWADVLAKCATMDPIPTDKLLYLSPSNAIGPGSCWVRSDDDVYNFRFSLTEAVAVEAERDQFIEPGAAATCDGSTNSQWSIKPSVLLSSPAAPIEGDLAVEMDEKASVKLSVKTWRWMLLRPVRYEEWSRTPRAGVYGAEVQRPGRLIMTAAVKVEGMQADIVLSDELAAKVRAKLPVGGTVPLKADAGLTVSWKDNRTLSVTSAGPFYIAGLLRPMRDDGTIGAMSSSDSLAVSMDVPAGQTIRVDPVRPNP